MPIEVLPSVEPMSPASLTGANPILISSDASRFLAGDLFGYCAGRLSGRSFLISGHRGSGKTTLVTGAVFDLLRSLGTEARPLLVTLHGPTLFPPEGTAATSAACAAPPTTAAQEKPVRDEARDALLQMILELHRATARAIAKAYQNAVDARPAELRGEGYELAAQLELELFDPLSGSPARLREFWRRGGFLPFGVLGRLTVADQGWRELLALAGLCDAYQVLSGALDQKQVAKEDVTRKAEAGVTTGESKDLSNALVTVLTGGLVGVGAHAANASPETATILGILGALGTAFSVKVSASRAINRTVSRESTFVPDRRPETLDRVLPVLLERLREAGLCAVFLVDELDKVPDLSRRMRRLVPHLKKLVAERAFFCFLTDRDYYEEMNDRGRRTTYSVEYTYFTDRLFVAFAPEDLHAYLSSRLRRPPKPEPGASNVESGLDEHTDYPFVPYVVLHRAQMHALDIQREIAALQTRGGIVERPGRVRTDPAYILDLILQLGVEMVLDDKELQAWVNREPTYRRLAHDALYYLARRWGSPPDEIDLHDGDAFEKYLVGRTGSAQPISFSEDALFLLEKVRSLAQLVSDHTRFRPAVESWSADRMKRTGPVRPELGLANEVLDAVRTLRLESMPLEKIPATQRYRWRYDRAGQRRPTATVPPPAAATAPAPPPPPAWKADAAFILDLAAFLTAFTQ